MELREKKLNSNPSALLPILIFLVLYLGMGLIFEYGIGINMAFYDIPIVVTFMVALLVACLQNKKLSFDEKLVLMGRGVGDKNIITMILIFLVAGVFVGVTGRNSAEAVAYFLLSIAPAWASVAVLFVAACFVSTAMGTSTGTITLITPIAVAVSQVSGFSLPLCVGTVMGGAMFGDNLSFISDTTIAACSTQGCEMRDKFRANVKIALPAAIATLAVILAVSFNSGGTDRDSGNQSAAPHPLCAGSGWRPSGRQRICGTYYRHHIRPDHHRRHRSGRWHHRYWRRCAGAAESHAGWRFWYVRNDPGHRFSVRYVCRHPGEWRL